jgi:hypothetical protein
MGHGWDQRWRGAPVGFPAEAIKVLDSVGEGRIKGG